jgi:hypothetical protein
VHLPTSHSIISALHCGNPLHLNNPGFPQTHIQLRPSGRPPQTMPTPQGGAIGGEGDDLYAVLGLPRGATPQQVSALLRQLGGRDGLQHEPRNE